MSHDIDLADGNAGSVAVHNGRDANEEQDALYNGKGKIRSWDRLRLIPHRLYPRLSNFLNQVQRL